MIDPRAVLQQALKLSPKARAALAGSLIESLDADVDADAEVAWSSEIERRAREVQEGRVQLIPWDDVRRQIGR